MSRGGRRVVSRSISIVCLCVIAIGGAGCSASNPVAPIDLTPVGMFLTGSRSVTGTVVQSGLFSVPFRAYALTKDGGYQDVTGQATWTGTPTLVPTSSPGMFNSTGAGTGRATARYLGVEASLAMEVVPSGRTIFPTLSMIDPGVLK